MNCYIVLFKDGALQFFNRRQRESDFQKGSEIYAVSNDCRPSDVCEWVANGYSNNKYICASKWE
jgi:hypothetical protein